MPTSAHLLPNDLYQINPQLNNQQVFDALNACLCKAEALAITAATTDFEAYTPETFSNYLWALSDIIREAKWLHEQAEKIIKNVNLLSIK